MSDADATIAELDPRRRAFVMEMLVDDNPHRAALRVGFAVNALEAEGDDPTLADLMQDEQVLHAIRVARAQRASRIDIQKDQVVHETSLLAHSSLEHYVVTEDGYVALAPGAPEGAMRAIQSIKRKAVTRTDPKTKEIISEISVEIRLWDKPNPLKLLGRQVGLFPNKVEVSGPDGKPLETVTRIERIIVDPRNEG